MDVGADAFDTDRKPTTGGQDEEAEDDPKVSYVCASVKCRQSSHRVHEFAVKAHLSQPKKCLFCVDCCQSVFWKPPRPVDERYFKEISTD